LSTIIVVIFPSNSKIFGENLTPIKKQIANWFFKKSRVGHLHRGEKIYRDQKSKGE